MTDADPDAILASITIGSPDFAVRCAANKMMRIIMIGVKQADRRLGDRLTTVDARTLVAIVDRAVKELADSVRDQETKDWLEAGEEELRRSRPHPGR